MTELTALREPLVGERDSASDHLVRAADRDRLSVVSESPILDRARQVTRQE
jgi:hypothetical protein